MSGCSGWLRVRGNGASMTASLIQGVGPTYQGYLALIGKVVEEVNETVEEQRCERERALESLEDLLAQKSLRRSDFAKMAQKLLEIQLQREEEVRKILREFMRETSHIASCLSALVEHPDPRKLKRLMSKVEHAHRERVRGQEKVVECLLETLLSRMQKGMEEFRSERVSLNQEWIHVQEERARLALAL